MAWAWAVRPSASASSAAIGPSAATPAREYCCTVMSLTKSLTLRPPRTRAMAAGGQRVIGSGDVVAHGLRRPAADEDRAGVPNPFEVAGGVDGQMLGSDAVGEGAGFVRCGCDDDQAVADRALRLLGCRGAQFVSAITALARRRAGRDEDGDGFRIVLGLGDEVGGDEPPDRRFRW